MGLNDKLTPQQKSRIYVCATPVSFPLHFILHTFIVVDVVGKLSRYEVYKKGGEREKKTGFVYKDLFPAKIEDFETGERGATFDKIKYPMNVLDFFEYDETCLKKIETFYLDYPHRYDYGYLGPNSNTYTQWMLDKLCPSYTLPKSALGRNFQMSKFAKGNTIDFGNASP